MLVKERVEELLELQRKSYELLRWANQQVKARRISFGEMHHNMSTFEAAHEWIERNLSSLPLSVRPETSQVEEFAHLFSSYLTTSFRLVRQRWVSDGCPCSFCSYLIAAPHLQVKQPNQLDRTLAQKLKVIALDKLANSLELAFFAEELGRFISDHVELKSDIALFTWVVELFRRGEFRGQGEPVLALWREIAWEDGKPNREFELTTQHRLDAEARIIGALKSFSP